MLHINEYVVFSSTGVCQVTDIIKESFSGGLEKEYYVLTPVSGNGSTIYIPKNGNTSNIRDVMTKEEVDELFNQLPEIEGEWSLDDSARKAQFAETLKTGLPADMVKLIKTLHERQMDLEEQGKSLSSSDTEIFKAAKQLLYNEIALVYVLEPEQIIDFVYGKLDLKAV